MSPGFLTAAWLGLPTRQRLTISIESGIQNGTLALAIALGILDSARLAAPPSFTACSCSPPAAS